MITLNLNAVPRTGNTFLYSILKEFVEINSLETIQIINHIHDYKKLLINEAGSITYTNLRDPIETITSMVLHILGQKELTIEQILLDNNEIKKQINYSINLYKKFLIGAMLNNNVRVIFFDDLIKNTYKVIDNIAKDLNLKDYRFPDMEKIKFIIKQLDINKKEQIKDLNEFRRHLPHDKENNKVFMEVKKILESSQDFYKFCQEYNKISDLLRNRP
jgi:hypothetical protein